MYNATYNNDEDDSSGYLIIKEYNTEEHGDALSVKIVNEEQGMEVYAGIGLELHEVEELIPVLISWANEQKRLKDEWKTISRSLLDDKSEIN